MAQTSVNNHTTDSSEMNFHKSLAGEAALEPPTEEEQMRLIQLYSTAMSLREQCSELKKSVLDMTQGLDAECRKNSELLEKRAVLLAAFNALTGATQVPIAGPPDGMGLCAKLRSFLRVVRSNLEMSCPATAAQAVGGADRGGRCAGRGAEAAPLPPSLHNRPGADTGPKRGPERGTLSAAAAPRQPAAARQQAPLTPAKWGRGAHGGPQQRQQQQLDLTHPIFADLERAAAQWAQGAGAQGGPAARAKSTRGSHAVWGPGAARRPAPAVQAAPTKWEPQAPAGKAGLPRAGPAGGLAEVAAAVAALQPPPPQRSFAGTTAAGAAPQAPATRPLAQEPHTGSGCDDSQVRRRPLHSLAAGVTTLTIRNVPARYTQEDLIQEWGPECSYDFLHLPCSPEDHWSKGYAFVNFTSHEAALAFQERWHGKLLALRGRTRTLDIVAAPTQGYLANLQLVRRSLRNQSLSDEDLPATFHGALRMDTRVELEKLPPPEARTHSPSGVRFQGRPLTRGS